MFFNHILPFRSGELSLPFFLKRIEGVKYSESISVVILFRLFDLSALIFSLLLVYCVIGSAGNAEMLLLNVLFLVLFVGLIYNLKGILSFLLKKVSHVSSQRFKVKFEQAAESMIKILSIENKKLLKIFIFSLLDRLCNYAVSIFLILGMLYEIPVIQIIYANAVASLTNILPVNSIGSFGTLEMGWAGILMYFGVSREIAVSSGFNFHILFLAFTISLGLISLIILNIRFNLNPFRTE